MANPQSHQKRVLFTCKEKDSEIQSLINRRVKKYMSNWDIRNGNRLVWLKTGICLACVCSCYYLILHTAHAVTLLITYLIMLLVGLILAMTTGHDAAHGSVSGKKNLDNIIYQFIFILNGINPGPWRERHNRLHHHFPNVYGLDSDITITKLIYFSPSQKKFKMHAYQHLYAPVLYLFTSLSWLLVIDFVQHQEHIKKISSLRIRFYYSLKIVMVKCFYFLFMIFIPVWLTAFSLPEVFLTWAICQMALSLFLSFTFFISHHVVEASYFVPGAGATIQTSWLNNQVSSTVDFHGQSPFANLIFGGFHAHIAHHLFPNVSHIHYPTLTTIIKEELKGTHVRYQSINFFQGVVSHLKLLKQKGSFAEPHPTPVWEPT